MKRKDALLATLAFAGCAPLTRVNPAVLNAHASDRASASVERAFLFLEAMMDRYARGSTLRLAQSFVPTKALNLGSTSYVYDDDVMIAALLARGRAEDVDRAKVLGESLVYAQTHDSIGDGRIRSAYYTNPFVSRSGKVSVSDASVDTGNMAWTGMALSQLYAKTQSQHFLTAALAIANWIVANVADRRGPGGYTGGIGIGWKSTEHNLDVYALFTMLASLTGDATWAANAAPAKALAQSMWSAQHGWYWIGTVDDGKTPNTVPIPEDVQTWSYLSLGSQAHSRSIDWAETHLCATDGPFSGVSFSNADRSGVWFEGTGHIATALRRRNTGGDAAQADKYLADIAYAQVHAPHADGNGIVAASKDGLRTGDGDQYFAALHVGATGWYGLAALNANPFRLP